MRWHGQNGGKLWYKVGESGSIVITKPPIVIT